jgi:ABC-type branched-subunit amino acid transport system substrate-binding protein
MINRRTVSRACMTGLASAILLGSVACSSSNKPQAAGISSGGSPGGAGCNQGKPLNIGFMAALSGPAAVEGQDAKRVAQLALNKANAKGGALGRCLILRDVDDQGDPSKGAQAVRELIDRKGADFIVTASTSGVVQAMLPVTTQAKMISMFATGALENAGRGSQFPYNFRTAVAASDLSAITGKVILDAKYTRVGILAANIAFGQQSSDALKSALQGKPAQVVSTQFVESGAVDMTAQLQQVLDAKPDVLVYFIPSTPDAIAGLRARASLRSDLPTLGISTYLGKEIRDVVNQGNLKKVFSCGIYRTMGVPPGQTALTYQPATDFIADYARSRNETVLSNSPQIASGTYDSVNLLVAAVNGAHTADSGAIKSYIETHTFQLVRGQSHFSATQHNAFDINDLGAGDVGTFDGGVVKLLT